MPTTRCPYCHEYIDNQALDAHIASHRELMPDGQQRDYMTSPDDERAEDDLTDVPVAYAHSKCKVATRMPDEIVRSYLVNPHLYMSDKTFCAGCNQHVPYAECVWTETGENLQQYFDRLRAAKPEMKPAALRPAPTATTQAQATESTGPSWAVLRTAMGVGAVLLVIILGRLPRALKNAAQQAQPAQQAFPNNAAGGNVAGGNAAADDDWNAKIQRGEDVPEPILILAGIKPDTYRLHQAQLKIRKLKAADKLEEVVQTLDAAMQQLPDSEWLHNSKAWLLATCPDDKIRNGKMAVEHANKACELTDFSKASYIDTLAAAYAEAGDFDAAVKQEQTAIELAEDDEALKQRLASRLEMYKNRQAFRE